MNDNTNRPDYSYGAQPGPYAVPPAPPQPPKRRGKLKTIGIVFGVIAGLLLIVGIAGAIGDPSQTVRLPVGVTTEAPPAAAKKWVPLTTVTGGTEKTSDTIRTTGGKIRVSWTFTGGSMAAGAIYLLDEGTDLQRDGGIPVAMIDEASTKDSIVLRKAAGEYFVQVSAANAKYTVRVEEER